MNLTGCAGTITTKTSRMAGLAWEPARHREIIFYREKHEKTRNRNKKRSQRMNAVTPHAFTDYMYFLHYLHTTIRHLLVFSEIFSCSHLHKFLIINMKNTQQCSGEFSSFNPSKKVLEEGCKGEPWTVNPAGRDPANKILFPSLATGGPPGVIQRRGVGRQRRNP